MPRTRLSDKYSAPKEPPIDWLKAAILERISAKGYTLKTLAAAAGVSYEYMRKLMTMPPMEWPYHYRDEVCKALGIRYSIQIEVQPELPGQ